MTVAKTLAAALAALIAWSVPAGAAERAKAAVECAPTEKRLVYLCRIALTGRKSGAPLDGAKLVIGADMPSMPLAHNVRPVTAAPGAAPGLYEARLELEMHGEWALRLDVSGPLRDRLIHKMHFGAAKGGEAGHEHHMKK